MAITTPKAQNRPLSTIDFQPGSAGYHPHPLAWALAQLAPALDPLQWVLSEEIVCRHRMEAAFPRDRELTGYFDGLRGILLLDRYTNDPLPGKVEGKYGGFRLYLLNRHGYAVFRRRGRWSRSPRLESWSVDFRLLTIAGVFSLMGGEDGTRLFLLSIGKKLWDYANRHPYERATRQAEKIASWAGQCAAGRITAL